MQVLINLESKNFGLEVKKRLLDINMKQSELAKKMGLSEAYISEVLNGKKEALDTKRKILSVIEEKIKISDNFGNC